MKIIRIKAFTLIELMVVISIIALLIAILLPVLGSARTAAYKTASLSNLRQIAVASTVYAGDNKSSLPFIQRAKFYLGAWTHVDSVPQHYWGACL